MQVKLIRGFTLIELLIVVAIIGTLAAIGTVAYNGYVGGAKKSAAQNSMQQIALQEQEYQSIYGDYFIQSGCTPDQDTTDAINTDLFETTEDEPIVGLSTGQYYVKVQPNFENKIRLYKSRPFIFADSNAKPTNIGLGTLAPNTGSHTYFTSGFFSITRSTTLDIALKNVSEPIYPVLIHF